MGRSPSTGGEGRPPPAPTPLPREPSHVRHTRGPAGACEKLTATSKHVHRILGLNSQVPLARLLPVSLGACPRRCLLETSCWSFLGCGSERPRLPFHPRVRVWFGLTVLSNPLTSQPPCAVQTTPESKRAKAPELRLSSHQHRRLMLRGQRISVTP